MGVPLSNYTVLKMLADGLDKERANLRSFEMEYALNALENYSLYAFIIHDPTIHKDFHEVFTKQFKSMHYSSGNNLVFFGLVDSPKNYCLTGNQPFYADIRDAIELMEDQEETIDLSYSSFALANSLDINPEMLPVIIVTHDPRLSTFKWYKTCPDKMETQMSRLTGISNEMNHFKNISGLTLDKKQEILYKLLDEYDLDLCKGMGLSVLNDSMARALSDILSFLIQSEDDFKLTTFTDRDIVQISNKQTRDTLKNAMRSLRHLTNSIQNISDEDVAYSDFFSLIEELNLKIATYLTLLNKGLKKDIDGLYIRENLLETHSLFLLQTGLEVESFLKGRHFPLDYSPSAICLAKMFEKEISLSFVHWVRKQNSISLPEYFNKFQPGINVFISAKFKTGPGKPINFNSERNGHWQPPELGNSKTIAKYNISNNDWHSMRIENPKTFLSEWDTIHRVRNIAAHTSKVSKNDLYQMKTALTNLSKKHIFEKLADMKNSFRNEPTIH